MATTTAAPAPDDDDGRRKFTANPGRRYAPTASPWFGWPSHVLDGAPVFTWLDVPRMARDPQVQFGLRMLRAPFQQARFDVRGSDRRVARFVRDTLAAYWNRCVPRLLHRYFQWGFAAAVHSFRADRRLVRYAGSKVVEPRDATPLVWAAGAARGEFAGLRLVLPQGGPAEVRRPHALWFAGHEEVGHLYDRPRVAGAFEPWLEKCGRNGARHSRRLAFRKYAFSGGTIYHPPGYTDVGTEDSPQPVSNQDLARQTLEYLEAGGALTFENVARNGEPGTKAWEYQDPKFRASEMGGLLDYAKDLDREILVGLGIPPEVIEAAEVGSGWSGRMIPAVGFLGSADELVGLLVEAAEESFLRDLVRQNFGRSARYEIDPVPLAESVLGPAGRTPPPGPGGGVGVGSGLEPYAGPHGGKGLRDPRTGKVRYGASLSRAADPARLPPKIRRLLAYCMFGVQERAALSRTDPADALHALADLAADPAALRRALKGADLSWVLTTSGRGNPKAVWSGDGGRRPLYGERARRAVEGQRLRADRAASARRAHQIGMKALYGEATPDDFRELAHHLPSLTAEQLRNVRAALAARLGPDATRRDAMARALVEHALRRAAEPEPPPTGPGTPGPDRPATSAPKSPRPGRVYQVAPADLRVDPGRFQFKLNTNRDGVTDELKGVKAFNPEYAGVLTLWRDPETGTDYVVNGHHRHELATRTGHGAVNVQYVQAASAKEARAAGALQNIAEGRGTAVDAAKFFRDTGLGPEEVAEKGVSLKGRLADEALALRSLSDRSFDKLARGQMELPKALAVAKNLPDPARQDELFRLLGEREEKGKDLPLRVVEEMAREMADTPTASKTEGTLFGDITDEGSLFVPRNELKSYVRGELAREVGDFAAVSSERRVGSAGNVLNVQRNQELRQAAEQGKEVFDRLANRSGPVSRALNDAATGYAKAKTKGEKDAARKQALEAVRDAIRQELGEPKPAPDAGGEGAGGRGGGGADPDRPAAPGTGPAGGPPGVTPAAGADADPAAAGGRPRDPLMGRDAQLDVFGNAHRSPRPAKPAGQPSLVPADAERRDEADRLREGLDRMRDAGGAEPEADGMTPANPNPITPKEHARRPDAPGPAPVAAEPSPAAIPPGAAAGTPAGTPATPPPAATPGGGGSGSGGAGGGGDHLGAALRAVGELPSFRQRFLLPDSLPAEQTAALVAAGVAEPVHRGGKLDGYRVDPGKAAGAGRQAPPPPPGGPAGPAGAPPGDDRPSRADVASRVRDLIDAADPDYSGKVVRFKDGRLKVFLSVRHPNPKRGWEEKGSVAVHPDGTVEPDKHFAHALHVGDANRSLLAAVRALAARPDAPAGPEPTLPGTRYTASQLADVARSVRAGRGVGDDDAVAAAVAHGYLTQSEAMNRDD